MTALLLFRSLFRLEAYVGLVSAIHTEGSCVTAFRPLRCLFRAEAYFCLVCATHRDMMRDCTSSV